jgi:hypothetical protein
MVVIVTCKRGRGHESRGQWTPEDERGRTPVGHGHGGQAGLCETAIATTVIEGGLVNRCFQVGKVSRKAGKSGGDAGLSPRLGMCRKRAAVFPQPNFRGSPFLHPAFAIITGVLKYLFTKPPFRHGNACTHALNPTRAHGYNDAVHAHTCATAKLSCRGSGRRAP